VVERQSRQQAPPLVRLVPLQAWRVLARRQASLVQPELQRLERPLGMRV
jgi:hypothetical protein